MKLSKILLLFSGLILMSSCEKLMDPNIKEVMLESDFYNTTFDADVAVMGIYSKFMELADKVIILNELRADLMDVTENSSVDMLDLNAHLPKPDNKYCDPAPFYEVILNCNEALEQFDRMKAERILDEDNYNERYSDVLAIRCWVYLQLGIHYGKIPYVTQALNSALEVEDPSLFPEYDLDALLPQLIQEMENMPTMEDYFVVQLPEDLLVGYQKQLLFINKRCLLGDLYLWNNQYEQAATQYYSLLNNTNIYRYKATSGTWQASSTPTGFWISFLRFNNGNVDAFRNKWKEIFSRVSTDAELNHEMIWALSYDYRYEPEFPFIDLFANTGRGSYQLKPSDYVIEDLWESQTQRDDGFSYDARGREGSFDWVNGRPVVIKYLYDYYVHNVDMNSTIHLEYNNVADVYRIEGRWFLYRAALLHLRYAEAVNRAGYPKLALAFLNRGIQTAYNDSRANKNGCQYTGHPVYNASGNIDQTQAYAPYPEPYYFDARSVPSEYGSYNGPWRNHAGIRGRAFLSGRGEPTWANTARRDSATWADYGSNAADSLSLLAAFQQDSIRWVEEYLLQEAALELAFEGHRWGDLQRISRRRMSDNPLPQAAYPLNSPDNLLQRQIEHKFTKKAQTVPDLESETKWYLSMPAN